jgi:hypothetical protein
LSARGIRVLAVSFPFSEHPPPFPLLSNLLFLDSPVFLDHLTQHLS